MISRFAFDMDFSLIWITFGKGSRDIRFPGAFITINRTLQLSEELVHSVAMAGSVESTLVLVYAEHGSPVIADMLLRTLGVRCSVAAPHVADARCLLISASVSSR